jgi:hypothetical protein
MVKDSVNESPINVMNLNKKVDTKFGRAFQGLIHIEV